VDDGCVGVFTGAVEPPAGGAVDAGVAVAAVVALTGDDEVDALVAVATCGAGWGCALPA